MIRLAITILLLLCAAASNYVLMGPEDIVPTKPLSEIPMRIGDWKVVSEHSIDDRSMAVLLVDDYIMRTYVNGKGERIGLYVGYFRSQREGKQVHSPRQCLPGAGWSILESRVISLPQKGHNRQDVSINFYVMGKGSDRDLYLWWYQGRGRILAGEYLNKLYLVWDSISRRRTDGALVRVNMPVGVDIEKALNAEFGFVSGLMPFLETLVPN